MRTGLFWYQGLTEGMDQATDPVLTSGSPYLLNTVLDQPGNYASRNGSNLTGTAAVSSDRGYGLMSYNRGDNTRKILAVADRDLWYLNEGTDTWTAVTSSDTFPSATKVYGIDYLNRVYMGSEDGAVALKYFDNSTVSSVTPIIGGDKLAVTKSILAVGGNNIRKNIVFHTDPGTHIFYSAQVVGAADADVAGAGTITITTEGFEADIEGSILFNSNDNTMALVTQWTSATVVTTDLSSTASWDGDTIYVLSNVIFLDKACTSIRTVGEKFVLFDLDNVYLIDPTTFNQATFEGFGCIGQHASGTLYGGAIWINRDGVWFLDPYTSSPKDISAKLRNPVNGLALWDLIDWSNAADFAIGTDNTSGKAYISVGTLRTVTGAFASGLANAVLVFDLLKDAWTVQSYPDQIVAFTNFTDTNGVKSLYAIHKNDAFVTKLSTGTTDDDATGTPTAFTTTIVTPDRMFFEDPTITSTVSEYYVKYTCTSTVEVYARTDRGDYDLLATLDASTTPKTQMIEPVPDPYRGYTHGMKFVTTGKLVLEGYGFKVASESITFDPPE